MLNYFTLYCIWLCNYYNLLRVFFNEYFILINTLYKHNMCRLLLLGICVLFFCVDLFDTKEHAFLVSLDINLQTLYNITLLPLHLSIICYK